MGFGRFLRRFRPKFPGHRPFGVGPKFGILSRLDRKVGNKLASVDRRFALRRDMVMIPQNATTQQRAFLMDNAALLMDDESDSGTSWADVFGNLTSALAPAVSAAAGMYVAKELRQTAKNTGVAVPRGTLIPGPNGPVAYQPQSTLSSLTPYLLPLAGLAAVLLLVKRK